jgi:zinc protease
MMRLSLSYMRRPRLHAVAVAILLCAPIAAAPRPDRLDVSPSHGAAAARAGHATTRLVGDDTLLVDPALTVGILPNGLRYYIRANHVPARRAELRLVVNAGSVLEDEDQQGLAHFLEHMAFNGTTHFPKHALIDYLEHAGMRFGADVNAYTSFDETVYMLTVPTDEPRYLSQGLQMLADWAGQGMTLDSGEVVAERGVVLGEWRSRLADTATQGAQDHQDSVLYRGASRYFTRRPIGLTSIIANAQPAPIRRFYHDWYRPDLMAVVVVGDVDTAQVARAIRARFGRIPAAAHPRARESPVIPPNGEPVVDVYRGQVFPRITVLWKQPPRRLDTKAQFREQLVEQLLFDACAQRYLRLRKEERRPFFDAAMGHIPLAARTTDAAFVEVIAWPDSLESGLAAALRELERVARYGVPAPALERQKAAVLRQFESAAAAADARPSATYAGEYAQRYLRGGAALLSPAQALALARDVVPAITPADLARAAELWRGRHDLQVLVSLPAYAHVRPPTRESVLAIFDSIAKAPISPDSARATADAPLMARLPTPGRIIGERRSVRSGITQWTLSNGARVLFKPTRFDADELLIKAVSPGGFSLVPDSLFFSSGRLVARMMTEAAGVGALDHDALSRTLTGTMLRDFTVSITNNDESISLNGSPRDLTTLFELLHLQFTAPKLDTAALAGWKQVGTNLQPSVDEQLTSIFSRGDPRRIPTSWSLIQFADTGKAMAVYRDRFGNASDFTFLIVGNATAAEVRPLVERYLASLPGTGRHETAKPQDVMPWREIMRRSTRVFNVPKASTFLVFDGLFPSAPASHLRERERLDALTDVLRLELTDVLRERMGGTYGVAVRDRTYADPEEHYRVSLSFDAAPERMDAMLDAFSAVLDSVRARGATPAEIAKVAAIQRRTREEALRNNQYWLGWIERYDRLDIPFDAILAAPAATLTPADVRAAARHYLPASSYVQFTMLPTDSSYLVRDSTGRASSSSRAWPYSMVCPSMVCPSIARAARAASSHTGMERCSLGSSPWSSDPIRGDCRTIRASWWDAGSRDRISGNSRSAPGATPRDSRIWSTQWRRELR